jgi:hypothetical protein
MRLTILKLALQLNIINVTLTLLNTNTITKLKNQRNKCSKCSPPSFYKLRFVYSLYSRFQVLETYRREQVYSASLQYFQVSSIFSVVVWYTFSLTAPQRKKSRGVRTALRGGQRLTEPLAIHLVSKD